MKTYRNKGSIYWQDELGFEYNLCSIEYIYESSDIEENFKYIFRPNFSIIDLISSSYFDGIPGLNLDLRREEYIRENMTPVFISERVPQKNRENFREMFNDVGLDYYEPIEYLIRTDLQYFGDKLYVKRYQEPKEVCFEKDFLGYKSTNNLHDIIQTLCDNNKVAFKEHVVGDGNLKLIYDILMSIYSKSATNIRWRQQEGINKARLEHKFKGRKPIEVDGEKFEQYVKMMLENKINAKEAAKELGISIDKFYRYKRKYYGNNQIII